MNELIHQAAEYLRRRLPCIPQIALVLGSGLGPLADAVDGGLSIPYGDIPHFPASTAPGHAGRLVYGLLEGKPVLLMQGRFHYYEGHPMERIAFPVRVFRALGIRRLILTNAAGGANPDFAPGDIMLITDHLNLTGQNPLIGANDDNLGPRFPDMSHVYSPDLIAVARDAAAQGGQQLRQGVYAWFTGPSFETPAEIRMARALGADAVGMSTVPEAVAARHCGLEVLGISCITNLAAGMLDQPITGDEVLELSALCRVRFSGLIRNIIARIG